MDPAGSSIDGNLFGSIAGNDTVIYMVIFILSLFLSAFFSCGETAFTAASKVKLRTLVDKGNKRAKTALWICERFDKTLTTILIGNNVVNAVCASISALIVMERFASEYVVYGTLVTTLVVYLLGEVIPKNLAKARSEEIALLYAPTMRFLVRLFTPISAVFNGLSSFLARFFSSGEEKTVTEEELINLIETIEDEGVLEPEKQALVNSAMEFRGKVARDVMTPMQEVVSVSSATTTHDLAKKVKTLPFSRIPVYEGKSDNIVGILPVNQFLSRYTASKPILLRKMLLKPYVFPGSTEISVLLQRMRLNKLHMVFVTDEKRRKIGIVTMEDLLEELVGDIQDESDAGEGLQLV